MLASARMLPWNAVVVLSVAELPTRQNTLQALPPLMMSTDEAEAVTSVLSMLKTQTEFGSPAASRVRMPVMAAEDGKQWTPGASVEPPMSAINGCVKSHA